MTHGDWAETTVKPQPKRTKKSHKKAAAKKSKKARHVKDENFDKMLDEYENTDDMEKESDQLEKMISFSQQQSKSAVQTKYDYFSPKDAETEEDDEEENAYTQPEQSVDLEKEIRTEMENIFAGKNEKNHKAHRPDAPISHSEGISQHSRVSKQEFPSMDKHAKVFEDKAKSAIQQAEELEKQFESLTNEGKEYSKTEAIIQKEDADSEDDESEEEPEEVDSSEMDEDSSDEEPVEEEHFKTAKADPDAQESPEEVDDSGDEDEYESDSYEE